MLDEPQGLLSRDDPVVRLVDEVGQHQDGDVRRHLVVIRVFNYLWLYFQYLLAIKIKRKGAWSVV